MNTTASFVNVRWVRFPIRCTTMVCGQVFRIMALRPQHVECQVLPPFNHLRYTTQLLCWQSALQNPIPTPGQGSEHYLVAFCDKLSAAASLFFWHPDQHDSEIMLNQVSVIHFFISFIYEMTLYFFIYCLWRSHLNHVFTLCTLDNLRSKLFSSVHYGHYGYLK